MADRDDTRWSWLCTWEGIRLIGELRVLTLASYFAVIIVPIIAGAWLTIEKTLDLYPNIESQVDGNRQNAQDTPIEITLPWVWVWAYLAALFVIVAYSFYQAGAPDIVKMYRLEEYAEEKRRNRRATQGNHEEVEEEARLGKEEYRRLSRTENSRLRRASLTCYTLALFSILMVVALQLRTIFKAAL